MYSVLPIELWQTFAFLLGACVGSFLNVCIYRMPLDKSIVKPGSHCFSCGKEVKWFDNIPILSFFLLGGKCRYCNAKFSIRYAFVELLTACLFAFSLPRILALPCHPALAATFFFLFISWLVAITFIDIDHYIIPDEFSFSGVVIGLGFALACPEFFGAETRLMALGYSALGAFGAAFFLYLIGEAGTAVFKKEALGFGDVKLIAMVGAFLGLKLAFLTLFFSAVSGTLLSLIMIGLKRAGMKDEIPYGPYLALGAYAAFMWGTDVLIWYMGFFGSVAGN